ncbi:peptide chain release factor N(5)-glutamine methyltransferase [Amphibiibacter pelophylacis]|uniref:Peptide chain release factor N(5)-glutamine methyltransferase n=1 Tax=Amphibiibacter pelophylacis TaxID=1799477 RepID=A0ACC6P2P5_9BURK
MSALSRAETLTVNAWLRQAQARGLSRQDARHLLAHTAARPLAWLLMAGPEPLAQHLDAAAQAQLETHTRALLDDVPLAHVLGHQPFLGLELAVTPATLVPRDDTATLVQWALDALQERVAQHTETAQGAQPLRVLDLGTGSGAIILALAHTWAKRPVNHPVIWQASDRSAAALAVARDNARQHGLAVDFFEGDWLDALPAALRALGWDLILSNPPYIAEHDPHLPALRHEPRSALVSGPDGLDDLRRIVAQATPALRPGGVLLLEHGWDQVDAVGGLIAAAGLTPLPPRRDGGGQWRCSGGVKTPV